MLWATLGAHSLVPPPAPAPPAPFGERANKWAIFALAATGAFMTTLDSSIVNISLPSISRAFGVPLSGAIEWVIIGYLVVIAAGRPPSRPPRHQIGGQPTLLLGLPAPFL